MHPRRIQFLFRFGYDGSRFHGLQPQPTLPTAGGALRERIRAAAEQAPRALAFSARTDAGVHAQLNLATCWLVGPMDAVDFCQRVTMPRDDGLFFVQVEMVPTNVHARGIARGKRYRYIIEDGCDETKIDSRYAWQIVPQLDLDRMREGAKHLEGTFDFSSFRAARCNMQSAEKTLTRVRIYGPLPLAENRRRIFIELCGNAFLRKMVRIIVGTLAEVGAHLRPPADVACIRDAKSRTAAGITAPARGLVLLRVGCAWPEDGSRLLPQLAELEQDNATVGRPNPSLNERDMCAKKPSSADF